jgi:AcrR family transcriptional regulator
VENDARRRILDASILLLETEGLGAFSMREVARRAGLSHQAPYHHFGDREAILAALVEEGFRQLAAALAACRSSSSIEARLVNQGLAYVTFALRRSGHFRLMFRPELVGLAKFPDAEAAAGDAYRELEEMVEALRPKLGRRISADRLTSLHWAIVHGLAQLLLDGPLGAGLPDVEARIAHARSVLTAHAKLLLSDSGPRYAS